MVITILETNHTKAWNINWGYPGKLGGFLPFYDLHIDKFDTHYFVFVLLRIPPSP